VALFDEPGDLIHYFSGDQRTFASTDTKRFLFDRPARVRAGWTITPGFGPLEEASTSYAPTSGKSHRYVYDFGRGKYCLSDIAKGPLSSGQQSTKSSVLNAGQRVTTFKAHPAAAYPFGFGTLGAAPDVDIDEKISVTTDRFFRVNVAIMTTHDRFPNYDMVLELPNGAKYGVYKYCTGDSGPGILNLTTSAPAELVTFTITRTQQVLVNGTAISPGGWIKKSGSCGQ
jgi:hypothetical protein